MKKFNKNILALIILGIIAAILIIIFITYFFICINEGPIFGIWPIWALIGILIVICIIALIIIGNQTF